MPIDPLCNQVLEFWRSHIGSAGRVLVAVSGGSDSMALVHILSRIARPLGIDNLAVAHVNHGLRGINSDDDQQLVEQTCAVLGLRCHSCRLAPPESGRGIEAWAREERYRYFQTVMVQEGYDLAVTAHTADDQAETLLMRLCRGAGVKGACGIQVVRADRIARPLLGLRKSVFKQWLTAQGLSWRTDSSNASLEYDRNRLRHEVLGPLDRGFPAAIDNLAAAAFRFADVWGLIEPMVNKWIDDSVATGEDGTFAHFKGELCGALAREGIVEWFRRVGVELGSKHVDALGHCASVGVGIVKLPDGWVGEGDRDGIIVRNGAGKADQTVVLETPLRMGTVRAGALQFVVCEVAVDVVVAQECDRLTIVVDFDRVCGELVCRTVRLSDRFVPFGGERETGVLDFLKRQGWVRSRREGAMVVTDDSGSVVWVVGARPDNRFGINQATRRALQITCTGMSD